jgi:hypothetical protein
MEGIMKRLFVLVVMILSAGSLFAESVKCETEDGSCEFNEDGSFVCECTDGMGGDGGVAGSPTSDEDFEMPTEEECIEWVDMFCGVPEGAEECSNPAGECIVYAEGSWDCECEDGTWDGSWGSGGGSEPGSPGEDETEPYPGDDGDYEDPSDSDEPPDYDYTCEQNSDCPVNYICEDGFCEFDYENFEPPVCKEVLEKTCGTKAPDINDICTDEEFGYCTNAFSVYVEKCEDDEVPQSMVDELKEGGWNELGSEIAECCRDYTFIKLYMDELLECFETKSCEECFRDFEEQLGDDYDSPKDGEDGSGDGGNSEDATNEQEEGSFNDDAAPSESEKSSTSSGCSAITI